MPLQDHFHPPLSVRRHWHAFHNAWATSIASDLNHRLPEGYFAEPIVQFGIDVATFEEYASEHRPVSAAMPSGAPGTSGATWPGEPGAAVWAPPAPTRTIAIPAATDAVEVLVYGTTAGPTLAAAIELVSPANKDRPEHRDVFVAKCETYLQQGVGLVMVDVVTGRIANLHDALLERLSDARSATEAVPWRADLYAVAYRLVERGEQPNLDIWQAALALGEPLPTLPLWLRGGLAVPLDLEASYARTSREQRIPAAEAASPQP